MPIIAGQRLWNRYRIVINPDGNATVPGSVFQRNHDITPSFVDSIMVIPQSPWGNWFSVFTSVNEFGDITFTGPPLARLTVLVWEPHTEVGPGEVDSTVKQGEGR